MFLNALNMMIAPVVFFSIIAGITSMADASDISRIGGKLILIYMFTTVIAAVLGMSLSSAVFSSGLPVVGHPAEAGSAGGVSRSGCSHEHSVTTAAVTSHRGSKRFLALR